LPRNCDHVTRVEADTPQFSVLYDEARKIAGDSDRFVEIRSGYMTFHFESEKANSEFRKFVNTTGMDAPRQSSATEEKKEVVARNKPDDAEVEEPDPYENDPFFKRVFDGQWNALIGRQGHEENYLDGFIEAAIELADAIIEKQMFSKRDTLVLPILYNARHAVELALKFSTEHFIKAGVIADDGRKLSHNIKAYWDHLHNSKIGDENLSKTVTALKPFIESLSRIDSDGQELRYHRNRDDDPSLANYGTANLQLIRASLLALERLLSALKYRTVDYIGERATGAYTNRCSRVDLLEIARLLPRREAWNTGAFDEQKAAIKARYGLSNKQFSIALDQIQQNREMGSVLGIESNHLHLTDDDAVWVVEQWRRLHPPRAQDDGDLGLDYFDPKRFDGMKERAAAFQEVQKSIAVRLSPEALAELEAMFYLQRDGIASEYHEREVARTLAEHAAAQNPQHEISHLMEKTNFCACLEGAAKKLGRLSLAERLKAV